MRFSNLKSSSQIFADLECRGAIRPEFVIIGLNFSYVEHSAQINIFWLSVLVMIHVKIWNFHNAQFWAQIISYGVI